MAKLTKEQEVKNSGMFIHEELFLHEVKRLEDEIAAGGGGSKDAVTSVNGKTPDSKGAVTIDTGDIKIKGTDNDLDGVIQDLQNDKADKTQISSINQALADKASQRDVDDLSTNKLNKSDLGTEMVKEKAWTDLVARVKALEDAAQP